MADTQNQSQSKSPRGFAAMDAAKQREIASKGGRAAHESGNAHEFTPEEARIAGRKGGEAVSVDRAHMAEIGAKGGANSHGGNRARKNQDAAAARAQSIDLHVRVGSSEQGGDEARH
jgi:hypothetical protein